MIGRFYSGIKLVLPYSLSGDEYQWGGVIYGRGPPKKTPVPKTGTGASKQNEKPTLNKSIL
jgi:hypothetical protein